MTDKILNVWDIDDTLFKTDARVVVVKDGKKVKELMPSEFNTYKKKSGEDFDLSQFRSGKLFRQTAKPIVAVFEKAKSIVHSQNKDSKTIIITARTDLKDKEEFLSTFRDYGFPIDQVHVERAGNVQSLKPGSKASIAKGAILSRYLKANTYNIVRVWDDSRDNLDTMYKLNRSFPSVNFEMYLVHGDNITLYKTNLKENIDIPKGNLDIDRGLMPQIASGKLNDFLSQLEKDGIKHHFAKKMPSELKATQSQFSKQMIQTLISNKEDKSKLKPILISKDDYILDGHHRWLADYNIKKNKPIPVIIIDLNIADLLKTAGRYKGSEFRTLDDSHKRLKSIKSTIKETLAESLYK